MDVLCFVLILVTFALLVFVSSRFVLRFEKCERLISEIIETNESEDNE